MSALKWAGTEISLRKPYFIIMAPAFITVYIKYKTHRMLKQYYSYGKTMGMHEQTGYSLLIYWPYQQFGILWDKWQEEYMGLNLWISFDLTIWSCSPNFL